MGVLRPFFSYYGGKWRAAPRYPAPAHGHIIEPFAGSAGYALRFPDLEVTLVEKYEPIAEIWRWLISVSVDEVLALPDLEDGQRVDALEIPQPAQWLIGMIINRGSAHPRQTTSAGAIKLRDMGRKFCTWGTPMRERIASQLPAIRHWRITQGDYTDAPDLEADWFIDPPYQAAGKHYPRGSKAIDYAALGDWCKARKGQVIVCENEGADWLPFKPFRRIKSAAGYSREAIWTNGLTLHLVRATLISQIQKDRPTMAKSGLPALIERLGADYDIQLAMHPANWLLFVAEQLGSVDKHKRLTKTIDQLCGIAHEIEGAEQVGSSELLAKLLAKLLAESDYHDGQGPTKWLAHMIIELGTADIELGNKLGQVIAMLQEVATEIDGGWQLAHEQAVIDMKNLKETIEDLEENVKDEKALVVDSAAEATELAAAVVKLEGELDAALAVNNASIDAELDPDADIDDGRVYTDAERASYYQGETIRLNGKLADVLSGRTTNADGLRMDIVAALRQDGTPNRQAVIDALNAGLKTGTLKLGAKAKTKDSNR